MKCPLYVKTYKEFVKYRNERRKLNYDQTRCERKSWSPEHDALVLQHSMSDRDLSELIGHGVSAIQIRRSRLKRGLV